LRLGALARRQHVGERLGRDQRRVAVEDEEGAAEILERRLGRLDRVAGALLARLDRGLVRLHGVADLGHVGADHDHGAPGADRLHRAEHVQDHRASGHFVHDLGQR
jgi:hypothetical protein